ncbi:MAG: hypothetical protein ACT4QD_16580 [Acidobacteriota bacterium]
MAADRLPLENPLRRAEIGQALLLFTALTAALTYPLSVTPGSSSLGGDPDVHLFTWTLAWDVHALFTHPWSIFEANILHPFSRTLAFSENLIGSALLVAPVLWLSNNPVLALNAVSLLSCLLSGLGAYVLGRRLGLSHLSALLCGIVFAFSPARFFRFAQTHLTTIQWIPFALAALHVYLDRGRRGDLHLALAFATLQVLSSGHGAVYLGLATAVMLAFRLGEPLRLRTRVRDVGMTGLILLLPAALMIPPYLHVQQDMGLRRSLENWAPAPESFVASPTHVHAWLLAHVFSSPANERASAFLFPGYVPLLLGACALAAFAWPRFRRQVACFGVMTTLAVWLTLGPPLGLWPAVYWLPGLNFIRIPSRFILLAVLGLSVLVGIGFELITRRLSPTRRRLAAFGCGALMVAEFAAIPLPLQAYRVEIPAVDRWLDGQPKPFVVAEVPVKPFVRYHSTYMLHSMAHWQKTVHGHSGLVTPLHERLYDQLRSFPDEASLASLADLHVTYVVVHTDLYEAGEWELVSPRFEQYRDWLTLEHAEGAGRVYRLGQKGAGCN